MPCKNRIYVASIAGYDPSGGAGLLADIKTFQAHEVYGFGIITAITWQNDVAIKKLEWQNSNRIIQQLALLINRFQVDWFKIGIIKDISTLKKIIEFIKHERPHSKIIFDPVLRASCGFNFGIENVNIQDIIRYIDIITPNTTEFKKLFVNEKETLSYSNNLIIYRKGGHNYNRLGEDILYWKEKRHIFKNQGKNISNKHGSGCVFSSALCANLAKGFPLEKSCSLSKRYIENFLSSHPGLLGSL